ncbi:MAG: iron-containing alcohol dehydrogenase family protein [Clostridia bacterium]|nr:iron-containing alcohol dehydrogenase family protein [Clostridia bacterium]
MKYNFLLKTKVIFGTRCMAENKSELKKFGNRALIVTGKTSGKQSGALDDTIEVLKDQGIGYAVFDKVLNNPTLENVFDGGQMAAETKADFIIGIGGGSPLDASKAVAAIAVNNIKPLDLFNNVLPNKPLPIVAIPTTAGTGSEVTAVSIITRHDLQTKMSFGNEDTFPVLAFLDARYTESMPYEVTVNTAVDALSHAVEGYLSNVSTPVSDVFAVESIRLFGDCLSALLENRIDYATREKLLHMSMLGGMTVAQTGTTIVHGMGYSLTYFKDIPHGKANGLFMREYLKFNYDVVKEKTENILRLLKLKDIDEFGRVMDKLLVNDKQFNEEEFKLYASLAMKQKSAKKNAKSVTDADLVEIMKRSLLQ